MATKRKGRGRPKGQQNYDAEIARGELTRCPSCGSTDREAYWGKREHQHDGLDDSGRPFTHVCWRKTRCKVCGQIRVDRTLENRR